jgi:hypothetical protein
METTIIQVNPKIAADLLIEKLPKELVDIIKLYTGDGCWQNGKYINLYRIPRSDPRYEMLRKRPRIKQVFNDYREPRFKGSVWFKLPNGKFVVINAARGSVWTGHHYMEGEYWEMHYNKQKTLIFRG